MKHVLLPVVVILFLAAAAYAVPTDVTYADGDATTRLATGKQHDTVIGDVLNTGDSIKTGSDGEVEMNQKGVTIRVNHGTVFTLMEREQKGQKSPVVSVALGSIKFRYTKLTGQEPLVRTNSAVLGVRGTDFTVFSGADGSTLIAVDSGQVTVEAEGTSVELAAAEGVEVPLGQAPGDKFTVHSDQIDYSKWNDDKLKAMLADPIAAIATLEATLSEYVKSIDDYYSSFAEYNEKLTAVRNERVKIFKEKGAAEAQKFLDESEMPIAYKTGLFELNMRYFSIGALSLRRFVAGRLYLNLKSKYITHQTDPAWTDFLEKYRAFLSRFEQSVALHLVPADI